MFRNVVKVLTFLMTFMVINVGSAAAQTEELLLLPAATDISTVEWKSKYTAFPLFKREKSHIEVKSTVRWPGKILKISCYI